MSDKPQQQQILTEPENKLPDFSFDQLPPAMRESVERMGWPAPMPVQAKAVPYLLDKRDMIVQSRTGSGKTGAFMMPLLMRIDPSRRHPQALVLVPTRELAGQVYKEFETLAQGMNLEGALLYGGVGYNAQLQSLRAGAQVIIGTPGRVLDHIGRRALNLDRLNIIVFDEADEMLSMGFYPDMRELRRYLPRDRSSWMFSATMPYKVQLLAREFLREPEFLSLSSGDVTVSTMEHRFYDAPPLEKDLMLMRIIELENPDSVIIFCNTKVEVEYVATVLRNYGYNADQLSGDLDQKSRERAMGRIRRGETRFLVATDVAARGIDISDLSHVIQYDVPKDPDSYVHRAGRTARAGNTGVVITFISNMSEKSDLKKIARRYNIEFVEMPSPTAEEVEQRMAERVTVVLEDRFRSSMTRLQRERMKRFLGLAKSLAGGDDESMLLAMLLDNIYQETFHSAPVPSPDTEEVLAPVPVQVRREQPAPARREQAAPSRQEPSPPAAHPEGEQSQGEGGRKKKRKRKRNRNRRGAEGETRDGQGAGENVAPSQTPQPAAREGGPVQESRPAPAESRPVQESRPAPVESRSAQESRPAPAESRPAQESRPALAESRPVQESRPVSAESRPAAAESSPVQESRSVKESRPVKERPSERKTEARKGSTRVVPLNPDDEQWLESIEVIEPENWVEPQRASRDEESRGKKDRRKGDERRGDAGRGADIRKEQPASEKRAIARPEPAPTPKSQSAPKSDVPKGEPSTTVPVKEPSVKEVPVKEVPVKEAPVKKSPAKEAAAKKSPAKASSAKKSSPKEPIPAADEPVAGEKRGAAKAAKPASKPVAAAATEPSAASPGKGARKAKAPAVTEPAATEAPQPPKAAKAATGSSRTKAAEVPSAPAEKKGRATKKTAVEEPAEPAPVAAKSGRSPKKNALAKPESPAAEKKGRSGGKAPSEGASSASGRKKTK